LIPVFIGGNATVDGSSLVAILDYSYFASGEKQAYLARLWQANKIMDITGGSRPKSLVVTDDLAYISPISPLSLKGRTDRLSKGIYEINCVEEG